MNKPRKEHISNNVITERNHPKKDIIIPDVSPRFKRIANAYYKSLLQTDESIEQLKLLNVMPDDIFLNDGLHVRFDEEYYRKKFIKMYIENNLNFIPEPKEIVSAARFVKSFLETKN